MLRSVDWLCYTSPIMGHFKVPADMLDQWASTKPAEDLFPELVRLLIQATVPATAIVALDFPSGEKGNRRGYDGTLEVRPGNGTAFVPDGHSVWELGTNEGVEKKLDGDYDARITDRDPELKHSIITYIGATPRRFAGRETWENSKSDLKQWGGIRCYDSSSFEQWLESAPAVARWLSTKPPFTNFSGAVDLETNWENLKATLPPQFPTSVFLLNQEETIKRFKAWLEAGPDALYARGQAPQEVIDVFNGWVQSLPQAERERITSRTLIVEERETWRILTGSNQPLILVSSERLQIEANLVAEAKRRGHHVLVLDYIPSPQVLRLERMNPAEVAKQLHGAGYDDTKAATLARQSAGSSYILTRLCSQILGTVPPWSSGGEAPLLAQVLLAGAWKEENFADKEAIAELTFSTYADVREKINRISNMSDAPVQWSLGAWHFISPLYSWTYLQPSLAPEHLDKWQELAVAVLGEDSPVYTLPAEKRHAAAIYGKVPKYSYELRRGIANTLALLGTRESQHDVKDRRTRQCPSRARPILGEVKPERRRYQESIRGRSAGTKLGQAVS
jgi:hypothetical protein